ncbi:MAG: hypothetical protein ACPGVZ_16560 [Myxococcota bacterium]
MSSRRSFACLLLGLTSLLLALVVAGPAASQDFVTSATIAGDASAAPVDPAQDPWLREQAPVVAKPVEISQERVAAAWQGAPETDHARAAALRRARLEFGLGDLVAPATVIAAGATEEAPEVRAALARDLAPGVPARQIDHAIALFRAGDTGAATLAVGDAGLAFASNLIAQLWWVENAAFVLLVCLLGASFALFVLSAILVWSHAAHDLGDLLGEHTPVFARHAALAAWVLAPFALGEGLLGLAVAFFTVGFWYGNARQRNALVMAAILFVVAVHPVAQLSALTSELVEGDRVVSSTLRVLADQASAADLEILEAASSEDAVAAHALVYRDRRYGLMESSRERLLAIVETHPSDYVALANLGNLEHRRGNLPGAIDYYERAAAVEYDATLLFDLSQAYAGAFRMEEYEATLERAQVVDDEAVAALSNLGESSLVADLGFPMFQLRERFAANLLGAEGESYVVDLIAPGLLAGVWYVTAGIFAVVALLGVLVADRWDHSSTCSRCGHRICNRCEETVWSSEICEDCHHLFQYPEATDPSLRMARMQALSEREALFDKVWLSLSLGIPGMAGFAAKRPDLSMMGLLLFSWVVATIAWPSGPFEDPQLMGFAAWVAFAIPGFVAAFAYAGVVLLGLIVRKSR